MQIDIDFETCKALTGLRRDERDSLSDVIRRLVGVNNPLSEPHEALAPSALVCVYKGVEFPEGTRFRATYKGRVHHGKIKDGVWNDELGQTFTSPSQAAYALTGGGVNGWTFWECRRPADAEWTRLSLLRREAIL